MTRPVNVVVVAYQAADDLDRCLATLDRRFETTVVDNSSSAAVRAVAVCWGAEYVDAGENLGFGSGVNLALRRVLKEPPRDVLLVNPDAAVAPGEVEKLAECLSRPGSERMAAVSPCLVDADGMEQRVVWPFPSPWRAWAEALGLGRLPARHTFVIGAVLLLRWEALHDVGLFDEQFFLYAEETDWQRRALAVGWRSGLCREVVASHVGAGTSADSSKREALFHAAHETYIRKWYGQIGWCVYRCAACLGAAARAVVRGGDRRADAARRAFLYLRGPRRCAELERTS